MKIKINRSQDLEVKNLMVIIGDDRYRISETIDGRLCINKTSDSSDELIKVHPRSGNEIELS